MDDSDSDIDSQMVLHSDPIVQDGSLVEKFAGNPKKLGKHPVFEFINKRNQSFSYNIFTLTIYCIKFIATVLIITIDPTNCQAPVDVWLAIISFHDFLVIIARIFLISKYISRRRRNAAAYAEEESCVSSNLPSSEDGFKMLQMQLVSSCSETKKKKLLKSKRQNAGNGILSFTLVIFLGLFIWGQWIYFVPYSSCGDMPTLKKVIFLINVFFGYLYIAMPLIFLAFGCISLAWLFVGSRCWQKVIRRGEKTKVVPLDMSRSVIKEKYNTNCQRSDCGICSFEYNDGEEVVRLDCDFSHTFHEKCLEKWMKKRKACPICGKKIDTKGGKKIPVLGLLD